MNLLVNYAKASENHMRSNVLEAVKFFIQSDIGSQMVLFPQALNPFLKSLESMGEWKNASIFPYHDDNNKPLYIIVKIDGSKETTIVYSSNGEEDK